MDKTKPAADKWLIDRALSLSPRSAPLPALKYRLYPPLFERKRGNAVPIYLRLVHDRGLATQRRWIEEPQKLNKLPLDRLPLKDAHKFLDKHRYMLQQLALGARRDRAEWEYAFDAGDPIGMLLPDIQSMRNYVPLLVLQARVLMAERKDGEALRVLETGFALSRHTATAPFLISSLVGLVTASQCADALLDFIDRPDAPNLYWALTALPRPLISLRKSEELEQNLLPMQFPDLADLNRPRTAEQWDEVLHRVRKEYERLTRYEKDPKRLPEGATSADPASRSPDLASARNYLIEQRKQPAATVKAMPPAQVLVLAIADTFEDYRDDQFKAAYLPFLEARPALAAAHKRLKDAPDTEATRYPKMLLPALEKVLIARNRLERRIAALRVIEAVRLHMAANDGRLPEKLSDATAVPIPDDPGTGKPFLWKRDGATATLIGTMPGDPQEHNGLRYRLSVRSK